MSLLLIEQKIKQLDYKTHSPAISIIDELQRIYLAAAKNKDKFVIINIMRIMEDWLSSTNNGLYSKLPSDHKDYFEDQMILLAKNKIFKTLINLRSRIEIAQKISLVRKNDKGAAK